MELYSKKYVECGCEGEILCPYCKGVGFTAEFVVDKTPKQELIKTFIKVFKEVRSDAYGPDTKAYDGLLTEIEKEIK